MTNKKYIKAPVKVSSYTRFDPRIGKKVKVSSYTRMQKMKAHGPKAIKLTLNTQQKELDWSHLSAKYPNIMGLTDEEIEKYIDSRNQDREWIREYIKHIKCYNRDDLKELSQKAHKDLEKNLEKKLIQLSAEEYNTNPFTSSSTVYVTSPRGGLEILSDFAYANDLSKANIPYDFKEGEKVISYSPKKTSKVLSAESLPYKFDSVEDVNDIVYVDDIYMSGEQSRKAAEELKEKIQEFDTDPEEKVRIHYIALVGNTTNPIEKDAKKWDTFTIADKHTFKRTPYHSIEERPKKEWFDDVSAVVFPFSIPDGSRHYIARDLYKKAPKSRRRFEHR
jgi:hypothetical protein